MARQGSDRKVRTGNLLDYVHWRGDLTFASDPWHKIDSLIAAVVAYANFGENELVFGSGREIILRDLPELDTLSRYPQRGALKGLQVQVTELLGDMARAERFAPIRVLDQVNDEDSRRNIQFSAVTLDVPDTGTVIAFRGTDPTLVGWKEDFMMSYMSPVPAQAAAVAYLKKVAGLTTGSLILTGHSKGGNLAIYAAAHAEPEIQARLRAICSFDGPGVDDETMESERYKRIVPRICSILPSDSIIGRLMNYPSIYHVVSSTKASILQHDPFSWNLVGRRFDEVEGLSVNARLMDKTLHEWIKSCTPAQRELFTEAVFGLLERDGGERKDLGLLWELGEQAGRMDEGTRQMVASLLSRLIGTHFGNIYDSRIRQPILQAVERLIQGDGDGSDMGTKSVPIRVHNSGDGYRDAVAQTRLMAEINVPDHRDALRMELLAEEMLSMMSALPGEVEGTFQVECAGNRLVLRLSAEAATDGQLCATPVGAIAAGEDGGFLDRLGDAFQQAMASDADRVALELGPKEMPEARDRYGQSLLLKLADDVKIDVRGGMVTLAVGKGIVR